MTRDVSPSERLLMTAAGLAPDRATRECGTLGTIPGRMVLLRKAYAPSTKDPAPDARQ